MRGYCDRGCTQDNHTHVMHIFKGIEINGIIIIMLEQTQLFPILLYYTTVLIT